MIRIPEENTRWLHRRMLGLTFFERRLREAQKAGVEHVYFLAPASGLRRQDLPAVDRRRTASFSLIDSPDAIEAGHGTRLYEVELYAVIDSTAPFEPVLRLDSDASWREAVSWHKRKILTDSSAGWVARKLNKPISLTLSSRLAATPLRPNHLTFVNLLVGAASALVVAQPGYGHLVLGAALFQLASILDGVDGELAKFRLESSRLGAWLDTFVDNTSLFAFLGGCSVHLYYAGPLAPAALLSWATVALGATVLYLGLQLHFVVTRLGEASLAVWMKRFVRKLPPRDPVVRLVEQGNRILLKDFISFLFLLVALTGHLEGILFLGAPGMVLAVFSAGYLNVRYRHLAERAPLQEPALASDSAVAASTGSAEADSSGSSPRRWSRRSAIG